MKNAVVLLAVIFIMAIRPIQDVQQNTSNDIVRFDKRFAEIQRANTIVNITCFAYYNDGVGGKCAAKNVKLEAMVENTAYPNGSGLAKTYGTAVTSNNGFCVIGVNVNRSVGQKHYNGDLYDVMDVLVYPQYNPERSTPGFFYLVHSPVPN